MTKNKFQSPENESYLEFFIHNAWIPEWHLLKIENYIYNLKNFNSFCKGNLQLELSDDNTKDSMKDLLMVEIIISVMFLAESLAAITQACVTNPKNIQKHLKEFNATKFYSKISSMDDTYLFSWDEIPGEDSDRLIEFIEQKFGIGWIKTANIEKMDNVRTIRVSTEKNSLSLKLNREQTKAVLTIDNVITDPFIAKMENGKLNIYDNDYYAKILSIPQIDLISEDKRETMLEGIRYLKEVLNEIKEYYFSHLDLFNSYKHGFRIFPFSSIDGDDKIFSVIMYFSLRHKQNETTIIRMDKNPQKHQQLAKKIVYIIRIILENHANKLKNPESWEMTIPAKNKDEI